MSRNQSVKSKIIAGLAVVGVLMVLSSSRASAQLTVANYVGRYACTNASDDDFFTAIIKYGPNGGGAYTAGTLIASANAFVGFPTVSASGDYCIYTLDPAASSYSIGTDGTGFEELTWTSTGTNNATLGCPGSFGDQTAIGLRNDLNPDGSTIRAEFASVNLLDENEPGHGHCLK